MVRDPDDVVEFPPLKPDHYAVSKDYDDRTLGNNSERIISQLLENAAGNDFFVIHTTLQKCYEEIKEQLDELAESALMIGYSPVATMKDFTNMASIKEAKAEFVNSKDIINFLNINL